MTQLFLTLLTVLMIFKSRLVKHKSDWFHSNGFLLSKKKIPRALFHTKRKAVLPKANHVDSITLLGINVDRLIWTVNLDRLSQYLTIESYISS